MNSIFATDTSTLKVLGGNPKALKSTPGGCRLSDGKQPFRKKGFQPYTGLETARSVHARRGSVQLAYLQAEVYIYLCVLGRYFIARLFI